MLMFLKLTFEVLRGHFLWKMSGILGRTTWVVPLGFAVLRQESTYWRIFLIWGLDAIVFLCHQAVLFPHQALIYLLTYIYLRRGESFGGRRINSSGLLNYVLIRAGPTWGDTTGKDCWSRGKQSVGWWFPTWPWGPPAQHKWYALEKMCLCVCTERT